MLEKLHRAFLVARWEPVKNSRQRLYGFFDKVLLIQFPSIVLTGEGSSQALFYREGRAWHEGDGLE